MIFINRNKVKKPDILFSDADVEHLDAHKHYVTDKEEKAYDHKLFKDPEVRKALEELFNKKCAYCESKVRKTSSIDKEHFRPKTKVKIDDTNKIRGYYWLAADWDNLLAACAFCNRTGTHESELKEEFVSGKLDFFPLSNESKRAKYKEDLKEEEKVRLLINPCVDDPEKMIQYTEDGEILPLKTASDFNKKKVKTSVEVFGLQRSELHKDRREKWKEIQIQIARIKKAYKKYIQYSDDDFLEQINEEFLVLKDLRSADKEHLAVVRFVIRQELREIRKILVAINNL